MKTCNRLHLEDIEPGDRLRFRLDPHDRQTDRWKSPLEFDITVREVILKSRHGPRILSVDDIEYIDQFGEKDSEFEFYLDDGWRVSAIS